jgi:hypothetical protein
MTLAEYVDVLRGIKDLDPPFRERDYVSDTTGKVGYSACYKIGNFWYWYSVSETTEIVLPSEVVKAILNGECQRAGPFKRNGFEATIRFDGHSFMINMGSTKPTYIK